LMEKYALGGGVEHQYLHIKTNNLPESNPLRKIENSYFLSAYGYIKADNRDNPNFPRSGLKFDGTFKYLLKSNADDFTETSRINVNAEWNQPISRWLSARAFGSFGTYLSNYPPASQKFVIGGYVEQDFLNYTRFYGLPFFTAAGDNKLILGSTLQAKFL